MSVEIFLKFGDIAGGYQDQDHKDWIEVLSFKLGFTPSRQGTPNLGAAAGKVNFQDLTFSLPQSKASPKLMEGCCTGKHFPKVLLDVVPTDESAARTGYLSYQLQDVRITSYQTGGSAGEGGVDSMAITFLKLQEAVEGQVGSTC